MKDINEQMWVHRLHAGNCISREAYGDAIPSFQQISINHLIPQDIRLVCLCFRKMDRFDLAFEFLNGICENDFMDADVARRCVRTGRRILRHRCTRELLESATNASC